MSNFNNSDTHEPLVWSRSNHCWEKPPTLAGSHIAIKKNLNFNIMEAKQDHEKTEIVRQSKTDDIRTVVGSTIQLRGKGKRKEPKFRPGTWGQLRRNVQSLKARLETVADRFDFLINNTGPTDPRFDKWTDLMPEVLTVIERELELFTSYVRARAEEES